MLLATVLLATFGAIWLTSAWSARAPRSPVLRLLCVILIAVCLSLVVYAFGFAQALVAGPRLPFERFFERLLLPLFALFPLAVSLSVAQLVLRYSKSFAIARASSVVAAVVAVVASPFALLTVGCGLAGACL